MEKINNKTSLYNFKLDPKYHQPKGVCDFRKIYNPLEAILFITNLKNREKKSIL